MNALPAATIFGAALPEHNVEIVISTEHSGEIVLEGPDLNQVRRGRADSSPWVMTLKDGRHELTDIVTGAKLGIPFRPSYARQRVDF